MKAGKLLKLGLVGMGHHMTDKLIPALKELPFSFHSAARNNQALLAMQHKSYQIEKITSDYKSVFSDPEIEAIVVAGSPSLHMRVVEGALKNRIPIFVEKPLSFSLEDSRRFSALAKAYPGSIHSVGFNFIFMPELIEYKKNQKVKKLDIKCSMGNFFQRCPYGSLA